MTLSPDGYKLRNAIAEGGFEVTPDELDDALLEAHERIGGGPCVKCGKMKETRFGWCFQCLFGDEYIVEKDSDGVIIRFEKRG